MQTLFIFLVWKFFEKKLIRKIQKLCIYSHKWQRELARVWLTERTNHNSLSSHRLIGLLPNPCRSSWKLQYIMCLLYLDDTSLHLCAVIIWDHVQPLLEFNSILKIDTVWIAGNATSYLLKRLQLLSAPLLVSVWWSTLDCWVDSCCNDNNIQTSLCVGLYVNSSQKSAFIVSVNVVV